MGVTESNGGLTVGLVMDFFDDQLLAGARAYALENGLRLDARWSVRADWLTGSPAWNGMLLKVVGDVELLERMRELKFPRVDLAWANHSMSVLNDHEKCVEMAVEELLNTQIKSFFNLELWHNTIDIECSSVDLSGFMPNEIPCRVLRAADEADFYGTLVREVSQAPKPVGIFLPHAGAAYDVLETFSEAGIRVPEDVRIVVIEKDVQQTAALANVPLSCVELNSWLQGFIAMEMIHKHLEGQLEEPVLARIEPKGVIRRASSCGVEEIDAVVAKSLVYLRNHFREPINVDDVVKASGVSRRLVEMRFRGVLNRGIREELGRLRMDEAKHLLREGSLSVTEIAEACGFSSLHYFSAAFKKEFGESPKGYKVID